MNREIPKEAQEQMKRDGWPSIEEQDKHWEDIGGNWTEDRIQANEDYYSLRDEGRSYGYGESYAERNT